MSELSEVKINPFQIDNAKYAWKILIEKAKQRQIVTYSDMAEFIGCNARNTPLFLKIIRHVCDKNKLPPLYALVVRKDSKLPGFVETPEDHDAMLKTVFEYADKFPSSLRL